ncbi:YhgE/Pip family protein [Marinicrinis sediminis]|uniref:YhgE/Pip family protein n=1 Tax=Marinicrinis sediminis TaxID=1652465 RepID=A0ABW5R792_9BACL
MKKTFSSIAEWKAIFRNRKVWIPVMAVLFVPLLYTFLFLWAFWDPYDRLDVLPVAVVNEDEGAQWNGESIQLGDGFVESLQHHTGFDWRFVSESEARAGLENNDYYMMIHIPADFSRQAASISGDVPEKAELIFVPNESYNFLSAQIGGSAVKELKDKLAEQLSTAYTEAIFVQVSALADGLTTASEGAITLSEGVGELSIGAEELANGTAALKNGSEQLELGLSPLLGGGQELAAGTGELRSGMAGLHEGLARLHDRHGQLVSGGNELKQGASELKTGLTLQMAAMAQYEEQAQRLTEQWRAYGEANGLNEDPAFQQLVALSQQLNGEWATMMKRSEPIAQGAEHVQSGAVTLASNMEAFQVKLAETLQGGESLAAGAEELNQGAAQLDQGLQAYVSGVSNLHAASGQLQAGSLQLKEGLLSVQEGVTEFSTELSEGARSAQSVRGGEERYDMIVNPVQITEQKYTTVPNYGTGFSPYFISLGLFVGALLFTIVFPIKQPAVQPAAAWRWFVSKLAVLIPVGIAQALIVDGVLLWVLKLEVDHTKAFILFTILTSVVFMTLIQFLVSVMGDAGRFVAILILILQLTTSAGTFPLELIPEFLQGFHAWLPMTYSVTGFKAVISSGNAAQMWDSIQTMLLYAGVLSAATWLYFTWIYVRSKRQDTAQQPDAMAV